ncbi:thioredoxin family protein [Mangrovivirga sp. M17]|uniref:Thioredoxin family protein n=1 Tax=Mangrovivirga halotolerans TaxID=2993936 RepID=A0ABT3RLZ6_9BACT|nr:thioredoxin family protein [Mangrovivirga halotolerans]MCX2742606.1 thioredoxin family protein [Mangrovivirga halotolerans]
MKKLLTLTLIILFHPAFSQEDKFYISENGEKHLCGQIPINVLEDDPEFSSWYSSSANEFELSGKNVDWAKNLKDSYVEIYFGSWCGDSKNYVPKFIKLWKEIGLKEEQLKLYALYDGNVEGKYKQGPEGEEKGLKIHRVPTFIFYRNDNEFARIVESPVNDLETDLAQIALGYPSVPNYRAADYMLELFKNKTIEEIKTDKRKHVLECFYKTGKSNELNTLGYVLLDANRIQEALFVFETNMYLFKYQPNVYDSYAEANVIAGNYEVAKNLYNKVLELDPENKNAKEKLREIEDINQ